MAEVKPRFGKVGSEIKEPTSALKPRFGKPGTELTKQSTSEPTTPYKFSTPLDEQTYYGAQRKYEQGVAAGTTYPLDFPTEPLLLKDGTSTFDPAVIQPPKKPEKVPYTWDFNNGVTDNFAPPSGEDLIFGAPYNALKNTVETGLAITDKFSGGNMAESFNDIVPSYKYNSEGLGTVGEIGWGLAGGAGAVKLVGQFVKELPKTLKLAVTGSAPMVAVDEDTAPTIVGEDAELINLTKGFDVDREGKYSDELLAKRGNLLLDALYTAGVVGRGAHAVGTGLKALNDYLIQPLMLGNQSNMAKTMVKDVLTTITSVTSDTPQAEVHKAYSKVVEYLKKGKAESLYTGDPNVPDIHIKRDTMGAIEKGSKMAPDANTFENEVLRANAIGLRAGMQGKGASGDLKVIMDRPAKQAEEHLDNIFTAEGGEVAMRKGRERAQDAANQEYYRAHTAVEDQKRKVISSERGVADLLKNDPEFGEKLKQLGTKTDLDFTKASTDKLDVIMDRIKEADTVMTKTKDDYYAAIPDDTKGSAAQLIARRLDIETLLDDNLRRGLDAAGDNFKKLNTWASNDLQDEISALKRAGKDNAAKALAQFKRHITDDQLDYIVSGRNDKGQFVTRADYEKGQQTVAAATRARNYFKDEYVPIWRDGPLEDVQRLFRTKAHIKPNEMKRETRGILEKTLKDTLGPEHSETIVKVLDNDPKLAVDYILAKQAEKAQQIINVKKKLSEDDIISLSNEFGQFGPVLRKNPEQLKRMTNFFEKLRDKKMSTEELRVQLKEMQTNLPNMEKQIFGDKYGAFFDKKGFKPRTRDDLIYEELFDNPEAIRDLPDTIKKMGKDNAGGLRAAFGKKLSDMVFKNARDKMSDTKVLAPVDEGKLKHLMKIGDELFKDKPMLQQVTRKIIEDVQDGRLTGVQRFPTFDFSNFRKDASGASDFIITQMFGQLNRMGARIRSGVGRFMGKNDPAMDARVMLSKLYSDADEFERIANEVLKDVQGGVITDGNKRLLEQFFSRVWLYGETENMEDVNAFTEVKKPDVKKETEKALGAKSGSIGVNLDQIKGGTGTSEEPGGPNKDGVYEIRHGQISQYPNKIIGTTTSYESAKIFMDSFPGSYITPVIKKK